MSFNTRRRLIWNAARASYYPKARRINIDRLIANSERDASICAADHLVVAKGLIDEALHALIQLQRIRVKRFRAKDDIHNPAFWSLVDHQVHLLLAIRRLTLVGLDNIARGLARSLFETTDLAVAVLFDNDLASRYWSDDQYDEEEFWRANLSNGRAPRRAKAAMKLLGASTEETEECFKVRKEAKKLFSGTIHSSQFAAMSSTATLSLSSPGLFAIRNLGHISAYAPQLCGALAGEIHFFLSFVVKSIISKVPINFLSDLHKDEVLPFIMSALVLQECFAEFAEDLDNQTQLIIDKAAGA